MGAGQSRSEMGSSYDGPSCGGSPFEAKDIAATREIREKIETAERGGRSRKN